MDSVFGRASSEETHMCTAGSENANRQARVRKSMRAYVTQGRTSAVLQACFSSRLEVVPNPTTCSRQNR